MATKAKNIEVLLEDQERINLFNRLNAKMHELDSSLKAKKKSLEDLEDAGNELMLSDDDTVRFLIGECMVHYDKDSAEEKLQAFTDLEQKAVEETNGQLDEIKDKMKELKALLYAKFGNSINLEEDP